MVFDLGVKTKSYFISMSSARERTRERLSNASPISHILRKLKAASYSFGGQNWSKLFEYHDVNYDGTLSFKEFYTMMRSDAKLSKAAVSDQQLHKLFASFDIDGGGSISYEEFISWVQPSASTPTSPPVRISSSSSSPNRSTFYGFWTSST